MSLGFFLKIFCLQLVCVFGKLVIYILSFKYSIYAFKKIHNKAVVLCHYKIIKVICWFQYVTPG